MPPPADGNDNGNENGIRNGYADPALGGGGGGALSTTTLIACALALLVPAHVILVWTTSLAAVAHGYSVGLALGAYGLGTGILFLGIAVPWVMLGYWIWSVCGEVGPVNGAANPAA